MSIYDAAHPDFPDEGDLFSSFLFLKISIDSIEDAIMDEINLFNIRDFHDKYWSIYEENNGISFNNCYDKLRIHIFLTFFEITKDDSLKTGLEENPEQHYTSLNKYLMNLLIKVLINEDGLLEGIAEKCNNIGIPDEGYQKAISACGMTKKLIREQHNLIELYSDVIHNSVPALKDRENYDIIEKENIIGFDTVDADLIFRLYLHGDKEISPSTYLAVVNGEQDVHSFDKFIVWLWDWSQSQKPSPKTIPKDLKIGCTKLISIVCTNNDQTKYTERDFNIRNPNESWKNFQVAANDSRKRLN